MTIDAVAARALSLAPIEVDVERGRLAFFARTIGETNPIYLDVEAAKAAGHRDLPVPPTFIFSLGMEAPEPFGYLDAQGIDLRHVLHGEQSFEYEQPAYAGDHLSLHDRITDVYAKRGGELEFIVKETAVIRGGEQIATARTVTVVRHPETN